MGREEYGEADILEFLMYHKVLCWKNISVGFFDTKNGFFRKNKSNFIKNGLSDITAIIEGRHIAIEVKTKEEMSFFDRPLSELKKRFAEAHTRNLSKKMLEKYEHAVEQRQFLDDVISSGGVGFFAFSIEQVVERLKENGFYIH